MKSALALLELLRPQQWYKNIVVFIGIIFSANLFNPAMLWKAVAVFFLLSLMSGVNYIVNDLKDAEKDKVHPAKSKRPIPSGRVSKFSAAIFAGALFLFISYTSFLLSAHVSYFLILFFMIGAAYTYFLKNIFLIDIIFISVNFVLRAIIGVVAIDATVSMWLIALAFFFSLTLAATKRKGEISLLGARATEHRKNLERYDPQTLDYISVFSLTSLFMSYAIYSIIVKTGTYFVATIPIVIYVIFRYLVALIKTPEIFASPEKFLFSRPIFLAGTLLALMALMILYLPLPYIIKF